MLGPEISGLVLTHDKRDPSIVISQLSAICGQVVVVQDSRYGRFNDSFDARTNPNCEITVLERSFDNFPAQRNAGIERAVGEWVLSIDSDELLSKSLVCEIVDLEAPDDISIYAAPKQERIMGKKLKLASPSGLINPLHPRLFRSSLRYAPEPLVHERFDREDEHTMMPLAGSIEHRPEERVFQLWLKAFRYGRLRGSATGEGSTQEPTHLVSNLAKFVMKDGVAGAAVAGMKIAYGVGAVATKLK